MEYIITTERLGLRMWQEDDFLPFAEMNKDPEVMKYFPATLSGEETAAMITRIETHFRTQGFGLFAVEKVSTKEFIGYTGFMVPRFQSFFTPCVEIGWRLKKGQWNKGYATEAAKACLSCGFKSLGFTTIYSFTSVINHRSEKLMQKIGMTKEARFEHPDISTDSPLCKHVLYKIEKPLDATGSLQQKPG